MTTCSRPRGGTVWTRKRLALEEGRPVSAQPRARRFQSKAERAQYRREQAEDREASSLDRFDYYDGWA